MASVATRAPKRELGPDWRDVLGQAVRRFAVRSWGALLVVLSLAAGLALASHHATDPSLSTAAGGPPANWLGQSGAYFSDGLLLLFGLGAVLFVPVVALGLTSGSAVSGLPGGWGGALGLAGAHGVDAGVGLIRNPQIAGPVRFAALLLFAICGLAIGYVALGLTGEEKD